MQRFLIILKSATRTKKFSVQALNEAGARAMVFPSRVWFVDSVEAVKLSVDNPNMLPV